MDRGKATLLNDAITAGVEIAGTTEVRCDGLPFDKSEWNLADYIYAGETDEGTVMYGVWFRFNPECNPPVETCITKSTTAAKFEN